MSYLLQLLCTLLLDPGDSVYLEVGLRGCSVVCKVGEICDDFLLAEKS